MNKIKVMSETVPPIVLTLLPGGQEPGMGFQVLDIDLTRPDRLITPEDLQTLHIPKNLDPSLGVVISGRAPIWLYGMLVHECHCSRWVACYDPRFPGAVVVSTHSPEVRVGQVIPWRQGPIPVPAAALVVVGPPNSGKSHLAQALFEQILLKEPNIYLQRANWDGEGNWFLDLEAQNLDGAIISSLKRRFKGTLTPTFFEYQEQVVMELRRQKKLVIVDVGGKIDAAKAPLLKACTHYLLISRDPEAIPSWHGFCQGYGLSALATIHSTLEPTSEILSNGNASDELVVRLGGWDPTPILPPELISRIEGLMLS